MKKVVKPTGIGARQRAGRRDMVRHAEGNWIYKHVPQEHPMGIYAKQR